MAESVTESLPAVIAHGLAQANSKKGEDAPCAIPATADGAMAGYAIFDGHGGRDFSHTVAHDTSGGIDNGPDYNVVAKLLKLGALPTEKDFDAAFWAADNDVGTLLAGKNVYNGSTAQVRSHRESLLRALHTERRARVAICGHRCSWCSGKGTRLHASRVGLATRPP